MLAEHVVSLLVTAKCDCLPFVKLLTHGRFAMTSSTSGLTWLELLFLTVAMVDNPLTHLRSTTAQAQKTLARQLLEFATAAAAALKFALPDDSQRLFLSNVKPSNRMIVYGYYNRLPIQLCIFL